MGTEFMCLYLSLMIAIGNIRIDIDLTKQKDVPGAIQMLDVKGWEPYKGDIPVIEKWIKEHPECIKLGLIKSQIPDPYPRNPQIHLQLP